MTVQCVLIRQCNSLTKMDCSSRDFKECFYFKQAVCDYCKKVHENCSVCKYKDYCCNEKKKQKRY